MTNDTLKQAAQALRDFSTLFPKAPYERCKALADALEEMVKQEPVAHQFQDKQGTWRGFVDQQHYENTVDDGSWPIRALYLHPITAAESEAVAVLRQFLVAHETNTPVTLEMAHAAQDAPCQRAYQVQGNRDRNIRDSLATPAYPRFAGADLVRAGRHTDGAGAYHPRSKPWQLKSKNSPSRAKL